MHYRYLSVVATIAAGLMIACSDAAVDNVTAPRPTVTPAAPVADQWPTEEELAASGIPSGIGISITSDAHFEDDYYAFTARAEIHFEWVNEASARLYAALINKGGTVVNSSTANFSYKRVAVPVSSRDTTLRVKLSTNNTTCGLTGKHSYSGRGALKALDASLITISLYEKEIGETNGPDVEQPPCPPEPSDCEEPVQRVIAGMTGILASESADCDDAPAPPGGGGDDDPIEVCYMLWREIWLYDWVTNTRWLIAVYPLGVYCFFVA